MHPSLSSPEITAPIERISDRLITAAIYGVAGAFVAWLVLVTAYGLYLVC
jgi:hypothetical protein